MPDSGGIFRKSQGALPGNSSMLSSSMCRIVFVSSVWLCTRVFLSGHVRPVFLGVYPDRWEVISRDHLPVGCVWEGSHGPACAVSRPASPHPCLAVVALMTEACHPWSVHSLSVLSLEKPWSISSVCPSDVGYADCVFVSVM